MFNTLYLLLSVASLSFGADKEFNTSSGIFETLVKSHLEDENKRAETELNATIRLVALDAQSKVTLEKKEVTSEEFEKLFHGTSEEPAEEA